MTKDEIQQELIDSVNSQEDINEVREQAIHWLRCLQYNNHIQKELLEVGAQYFDFSPHTTVDPDMVLGSIKKSLDRLKGLDK